MVHPHKLYRRSWRVALACLAPMAIVWSSAAHAEPILSDTITVSSSIIVNSNGIKWTQSIIEQKDVAAEDKRISPPLINGLLGGYALMCESGTKYCGPLQKPGTEPFTGTSDILLRGISGGQGNAPAFFFYSDPFGASAKDLLLEIYKVKRAQDLPAPLGIVTETGKPQDLSTFFGAKKGSVLVMSDKDTNIPEPGSLILLGTPMVILALLGNFVGIRTKPIR